MMVVVPTTGEVFEGETNVDVVRKMAASVRLGACAKAEYMKVSAERAGIYIGVPGTIRHDRCWKYLRDLERAGLVTIHLNNKEGA